MKVTYFKSSDGSLHESHEAYARHEAFLKMVPALQAMDINPASSELISAVDTGSGLFISVDDLPKFIAMNADAIREILNETRVSRRGRRPKE